MTIVADEYTHVIGVDTHAKTHTYVILDTRTGGIIDTATSPTSPAGLARALAWIDRRTSTRQLAAIDAEAAARTVLRTDTAILSWPRTGKIRPALRVPLAARRSMNGQRTASRNTLSPLLRTIDIDARHPLTDKQMASIAAWRNHPSNDINSVIARGEAVRVARDIIDLTASVPGDRRQARSQPRRAPAACVRARHRSWTSPASAPSQRPCS